MTTVVIDAEQMQLQVHESVGHPTELDRVYGTEAAYAGTSFLQPGDLGLAAVRLRAHEHHRRLDDAAAASARFGFDDEGVPAAREPIVAGGRPPRLPHLARDGRADRPRRAAARCAPTAGRGCRSCG